MSRITLIRSDDWLVPPHHPPCRAGAPHTHTPRHPEAAAHCLQSVMREKRNRGKKVSMQRLEGVMGWGELSDWLPHWNRQIWAKFVSQCGAAVSHGVPGQS